MVTERNVSGGGPISCGRRTGRPKEERRSTGIELGSLSDKKSEPKALLDHQAFCVNSAAVKFDPQLMEEQRQSISYDALIDKLVREIGRLLGKDANHLIDKITLHRVADQHPNCADIGAASPYDLNAFRQALESMLALYELN
jgi:hypothetical protein